MLKIRRAILSVSDKAGLVAFARCLRKFKVEIISTGGTYRLLQSHGISVRPISTVTEFPEVFDGRVKTLHPKIAGSLLYLRNRKNHREEARELGIQPIDMVVVNLYPFEGTVERKNVSLEEALEQIDIGGPTLLRAGAKNFTSVAVLTDPRDYGKITEELEAHQGKLSLKTLYALSRKVFELTSRYDARIADYLASRADGSEGALPERLDFSYERKQTLRYGENPHQRGALYTPVSKRPDLECDILHGKEISYNNLLDLEAAWDAVEEFSRPAACVIKHNTPCGIAESRKLEEALRNAIDCDPQSGFGGIVSLNRPCDSKTARALYEKLSFVEVVAAPEFAKEALRILFARKNVRVVRARSRGLSQFSYRWTKLGLLLQDRDLPLKGREDSIRKRFRFATQAKPAPSELDQLLFAWKCVKHVKSNGIVLAKDFATIGIGCGQVSRVDAVKIACQKAGSQARGSFLASDGFFPMPDNIEVAASFGIKAVVQPGGSIRDSEIIQLCDRFGIAMVLTGTRHFRH